MSRASPQLSEKDHLGHETVVARGADGEVLADLGYTQGELLYLSVAYVLDERGKQ